MVHYWSRSRTCTGENPSRNTKQKHQLAAHDRGIIKPLKNFFHFHYCTCCTPLFISLALPRDLMSCAKTIIDDDNDSNWLMMTTTLGSTRMNHFWPTKSYLGPALQLSFQLEVENTARLQPFKETPNIFCFCITVGTSSNEVLSLDLV